MGKYDIIIRYYEKYVGIYVYQQSHLTRDI